MVDDEARIGMGIDQGRARIHVAPAQHVDRQVVLHGRARVTKQPGRDRNPTDPGLDRSSRGRCHRRLEADAGHGWHPHHASG
jgi:hypothetical protein